MSCCCCLHGGDHVDHADLLAMVVNGIKEDEGVGDDASDAAGC